MNATHRLNGLLLGSCLLLICGWTQASTAVADAREWDFAVFLNDKPIGHHRFVLNPADNGYTLQTEAEFEVNVLFFTAYRYQHENVEQWQNGCLKSIDARTYDNGEALKVKGMREDQGFTLARPEGSATLGADCVRTFAYWDLSALKDERLLNSQTGEYQQVELRPMGTDQIQVNGRLVDATRYALTGQDLSLQLWYGPDGDWLKLSSIVENGRELRYERVNS
ncbi:MAG: DUF6134 family protein [Wenzhouxiangella sp.]|jgi:hypothetical protein|nr:DUF6134 family protein [Wenzhouxiangella sp.]